MTRLLAICCVIMAISSTVLAISLTRSSNAVLRQMEQDKNVYEQAIDEATKRHEAQVLRLGKDLQESKTTALYYKKMVEPWEKKNWKEGKKR